MRPDFISVDYEPLRLARYKLEKRDKHGTEELVEAYLAWANAPMGREKEWDRYCDIRDGYKLGTNKRIREAKRQ